jgi:4-hydroxy-2-oxoheptanedioate aldolase
LEEHVSGIGINKIKTNPVKDKLLKGEPAVGSWISLCSPVSAEMMARIGWDWLVVDVQHSPVGFDTMVNCFRAIQLGGAAPMARVAWNDKIWIQRTLDAGAMGLVIPMVNSVEEAKEAVASTRYSTKGIRSFGGSRLASYLDSDYRIWTEKNLLIMVMIETAQAVENVEAILSVDGVDGGYIGPADLALSMGLELGNPGPDHEAAMLKVVEAAKKTGKIAGKHCTGSEDVNLRISQGFQYLALLSDAGLMAKAAREEHGKVDLTGKAAGGAKKGKANVY